MQKRFLIPVFILALLFAGLSFSASPVATAASNLAWGSQGDEVVHMQQALNTLGYWSGSADGIYGAETYSAVTRFQLDAGLTPDGIVGPATSRAMGLEPTTTASRSETTVSRSGSTSGRVVTMVATGYDGCYECNKPYYGYPSYIGLPLARGIAAVDPRVIPMGTRLYVEGYGNAIAADQGNAIKGNRIDLFFESHAEALRYGIKTVKVTILG
ncbi:MAG: peptidoglycan-binding protein [Syntrophomonadaceae bacterium]